MRLRERLKVLVTSLYATSIQSLNVTEVGENQPNQKYYTCYQ